MGWGAFNLCNPRPADTQSFRTRRKYPPIEINQQMAGIKGRSGGARKNAGGRRVGAGRPLGSRNRPRLIHGLPVTDDPAAWLLAAMNHHGITLRLRMNAAKALLPYFHERTR